MDHPQPPAARLHRFLGWLRLWLAQGVVPAVLAVVITTLVHDRCYPPSAAQQAPARSEYGAIHLRIRLAGTAPGIAEPLLVCGRPGDAMEVFVRVLPHSRISVGIDLWGRGMVESPVFTVAAQDASLDVVVSAPAFFPEAGSPEWRSYTPALEARVTHATRVGVNGSCRLAVRGDYPLPSHSPLYYGRNPIGGSIVSDYFTGVVDHISQSF